MHKLNKTVCIIGLFPPPIHGFALVNEAMKNLITKIDPNSNVYNLSSHSLNRTYINISRRFLKFLYLYPKYILSSILNRYHTIYIGISGGFGQFYDLLILLFARITKQRIFIHHHSFSYLTKTNLLTSLIIKVAGKHALHIVLCDLMQDKLLTYQKKTSCMTLSNSVFSIYNDINKPNNRQLKKIGYLGNISHEKGIGRFFEVLEKLNNQKSIIGIIGGPFQDHNSEIFARNKLVKQSNVSYLGPIYDDDKVNFFNTIDVLLMPSLLEEAEPLVIHEAMEKGIPVIAFGKGCINEIIESDSGNVIDINKNFTDTAVKQITYWIKNPDNFNQVKINTCKKFENTKSRSIESLDLLISKITKPTIKNVSKS